MVLANIDWMTLVLTITISSAIFLMGVQWGSRRKRKQITEVANALLVALCVTNYVKYRVDPKTGDYLLYKLDEDPDVEQN